MRLILGIAAVAIAFIAGAANAPAKAGVAEKCYNFVQGNVPWDYGGSAEWNPDNVYRLCGATTHAAEPGRCFDRVMHGDVDYGGGTQWKWDNAVELCASTSDADQTIACFTKAVGTGATWRDAIAACKYIDVAAAAPDHACYDYVQGNIPWDYDGHADWNAVNVNSLCGNATHAAEPGRCFDQVMHGHVNWGGGTQWQWKNALHLCQGTDKSEDRISCFTDAVGSGTPWQQAIEDCVATDGD